jgi:light-regulated signal transduction histidine kinase (bacteriophytochrome)
VFQNLITNSIKFHKKDTPPKIQIRSEKLNEKWKFAVCDNGIGIAPEHFERVFDIFQRLHINEEEYEGNGIGLANCKKIIQLHQGEIWIESIIEQGTTFYFTIPILKV